VSRKGFIEEFKAFASKGKVIDLAVAVVIGTAFGKIVSSLVENIITPVIGVLMGGKNFSGLAYTLGNAEITYGVFIQSIIDFVIVAFFVFLVVKAINHAQDVFDGDDEAEPATPAEPPEEVKLLREIRDSLKK
jgi:large conductance mechanosensitive channel